MQRVRQICLPLQVANLKKILRILSELCQNAFEHSGDNHNIVMVQRYLRPARGKSEVQIAIYVMDKGVRQSLIDCYGPFAATTLHYLQAALSGKSACTSGRDGGRNRWVER